MARIELKALSHSYQRNPREPADFALQPLELEWKDGGAYALLGPSGCGKTTLLNIISGLIRPSRGKVFFDGRDVTDLSPQQRNIAQVFQFPVVYDTMTVAQNLAFPLKNRGVPADVIRRRVGKVAELLELSGELDRRASGLTADAKQKISLGRGLVREDVAAVLFDEPLTVIDPHLKWQLRRKLKQIHHELKLTLVYVTHDQVEALTFADRIMVMSDGRVMQSGTADQLFESPSHVFVGHFIGSPGMNFLPVSIADGVPRVAGQPLSGAATEQVSRWLSAQQATAPDASLLLGIRPEYVRLAAEGDAGTVDAVVERVQDLGTSILLTARVGTASVKVRMPVQTEFETSLTTAGAQAAGRRLRLSVINSHSRFYRNQDLIT
ncbi:MAG: ABC transporter ATP-binding protein [Lautropia sp.]|nr:ABC transporter ATP-binding protein [Lautropia sp.]